MDFLIGNKISVRNQSQHLMYFSYFSRSSHFRLVTVRMSDVRCILHSCDAIKVLSEFATFLLSTRIKMRGCIKYLQHYIFLWADIHVKLT